MFGRLKLCPLLPSGRWNHRHGLSRLQNTLAPSHLQDTVDNSGRSVDIPPLGQRTKPWKALTTPSLPYIRFASFERAVRQEAERGISEKKFLLKTLPEFSKILNGLRPGELTIFTGPTGCGKTTVLSQMSIDYACQGLSVLWGSFEIKNTRLAQVMLQQIAMKPLSAHDAIDEATWEGAAGRLRSLPMSFMNLFGSNSLDVVLDTMELSARQKLPPHVIILDNLQFMLSGQASTALDKWELMERAISSLRSFCNAYNVHVVLVVHPRKEMDDTPLGLASVSGTAKATQEADNVVILQKIGDRRYLEVKKNRFYGDLGRVRIGYIPESRLVTEIAENKQDDSQPSMRDRVEIADDFGDAEASEKP